MKIRSGFVGNSSSSSFLIYGIAFPEDLVNPDMGCKLWDVSYQRNL